MCIAQIQEGNIMNIMKIIENLRNIPQNIRTPMLTNKELDQIKENLHRAKAGMRMFEFY